MKDTDFIIKQGWMVSKLHLTGLDLELYALVYGYTKDGETWYETNIENMSEWCLTSDRSIQRHLKVLVDSGYLLRKQTSLGRKAKVLLQASQEILQKVEKGDTFSPIKRVTKDAEKGDNLSPITPKKGDKSDITPYIRIKELKDNKSILLSAHTRTNEEEGYYEIFFFRGAADPAAIVTDFVNWYEANYPGWNELSPKKRFYYATVWKMEPEERRKVRPRWLTAWADVCNWIRENDPDMLRPFLDVRFGGRCYTDPQDGGKSTYELTATREVSDYVKAHDLARFLNPLVRSHGAQIARWNIIKMTND